jgi:hypothetical protein
MYANVRTSGIEIGEPVSPLERFAMDATCRALRCVDQEATRALQLRVHALEAESASLRSMMARLPQGPVPDASHRFFHYTVALRARSEFSGALDLLDLTRALRRDAIHPFVVRQEIRSSLHMLGCAELLVQFGADTRERLCEAVRAYLVEVDVVSFHYEAHRVLQTMNFETDYDGEVHGDDNIADLMQRLPAKITAV